MSVRTKKYGRIAMPKEKNIVKFKLESIGSFSNKTELAFDGAEIQSSWYLRNERRW
jgi:hypothetical protein